MTSNLSHSQLFLPYPNFFQIKSTLSPLSTVHPQSGLWQEARRTHWNCSCGGSPHPLVVKSKGGFLVLNCLVLPDEFLNTDRSFLLETSGSHLTLRCFFSCSLKVSSPLIPPAFFGQFHLISSCQQPHSHTHAAAGANSLLLLSTRHLACVILFHLQNHLHL